MRQFLERVITRGSPLLDPARMGGSNRACIKSKRLTADLAIALLVSRSVAQFRNDPKRRLAARHALEIVEGVAPALPMIVPGRPGAVRAEDGVLQGEEFVVGLGRL